MATIAVQIANDYYTAYLSYDPQGEPISYEDVLSALAAKKVEFGIDHEAIRAILDGGEAVFDVPVAKGIPHQNGTDASIQLMYSAKPEGKPTVLEDGRVDFKNIGFLTMIKAGTTLARKTVATQGTQGTTVTGKTIQAKQGRDKAFRYGKNVRLSEDGLALIAEIDGKVSVTDDRVSVLNIVEIKGDVGIETGNIDFIGSIVVNGDVNAGYSIRAEGDITINGFVGGATLVATGNITVLRGIQGQEGQHIECGGNLVSNFINDATVKVAGDIEANIIMNSQIRCDGAITLKGKKGQLIGGDVICKGNLEAKVIGSELEIITMIKLGIDADTLEELKNITTEIREENQELSQLANEMRTILSKLSVREDPRLLGMLSKFRERHQELTDAMPNKLSRQRMLQALVNNMLGSKLTAGELYPGTRIRIGNGIYNVKFHMLRTIVAREGGEIIATGY